MKIAKNRCKNSRAKSLKQRNNPIHIKTKKQTDIKPGVTGWAQTHGFRGETRELSQMEERVKADIWYMEHWTMLLDLYIIYKTVANVVVGEKNAY